MVNEQLYYAIGSANFVLFCLVTNMRIKPWENSKTPCPFALGDYNEHWTEIF